MADLLGSAVPVGAQEWMWDWQLRARCRGVDSDVFFHPAGEREPSRSERVAAARAVCAQCPVRDQCAEFALQTKEPYGVWGGLSESERQDLIFGTRPTRSR